MRWREKIIWRSKVKRGYFEWRVIPYCSNISETTEASELNVGGYNLL